MKEEGRKKTYRRMQLVEIRASKYKCSSKYKCAEIAGREKKKNIYIERKCEMDINIEINRWIDR